MEVKYRSLLDLITSIFVQDFCFFFCDSDFVTVSQFKSLSQDQPSLSQDQLCLMLNKCQLELFDFQEI